MKKNPGKSHDFDYQKISPIISKKLLRELNTYDIQENKNKIKGSYGTYKNLINTHYHLVYEDCYRKFVQGIKQLKDLKDFSVYTEKEIDNIEGVNFYTNVELKKENEQIFLLTFSNYKKSPLYFNKRMKYNSLIAITDENFTDFLLCTLYEHDYDIKTCPLYKNALRKFNKEKSKYKYDDEKFKKLKQEFDMVVEACRNYCKETLKYSQILNKYKVSIKNLKILNKEVDINNFTSKANGEKKLFAIEMAAYFEFYIHDLYRLQNLEVKNLPFKEIIVEGKTEEIYLKKFWREDKVFIKDIDKIYQFVKKDYNPEENFNGLIQNNQIIYDLNEEDEKYSSFFNTIFDESQFKAIKNSLNRKVSLIQGAPGTGKTLTGILLTKILMDNSDSPILVVCMKNDALDQFLEQLLFFTKDIARLGGRCKNEKLSRYGLEHGFLPSYFGSEKEDIDFKIDENGLRNKKIIGMTTTGAAKFAKVIDKLNIKTIIIEEAAEVLESNVLCLLTQSLRHLIMIGDHNQLKPRPDNYELAVGYKFDVSLFERLINNGYKPSKLKYQRRMKQSFADFVRLIYREKDYKDHKDAIAKNGIKIRGMKEDMYFITHNKEEDEIPETTNSKSNEYEANYLVNLTKYLIYQGYKESQIVILSFYSAQVHLIKEKISSANLKVDVKTVDKYQGEENDIVLLSIVRSNKFNEIGFIEIFNRICVAFSRAKLGFYIIGNIKCLIEGERGRNNNKDSRLNCLWEKIYEKAKQKKIISPELTIKNRMDGIKIISRYEDFLELNCFKKNTNDINNN